MNKHMLSTAVSLAMLAGAGLAVLPATAQAAPQGSETQSSEADLDCSLDYSLSGWSAIYKQAEGQGVVTCANGQSMHVKISVRGGGLTAGKWHVDNGKGTFSDVHEMSDVLGSYAQGGARAGVVKSASAQVLTKGPVSLALVATGEGVTLGIDVGKFTISRK